MLINPFFYATLTLCAIVSTILSTGMNNQYLEPRAVLHLELTLRVRTIAVEEVYHLENSDHPIIGHLLRAHGDVGGVLNRCALCELREPRNGGILRSTPMIKLSCNPRK